jgi:DNA helicase IV
MRDIVATIAAEQDEVIRTPLDRLLIVQGGPGTGKTAVALHRAAYLLFEHRMELLESGVLVIGPNPVFLRYVADVLPSLGETAVRQTTIEGLRPAAVRLGAEDSPEVGKVKGDGRMAVVIDRTVRASIRSPQEPLAVHTAWGTVRLDPGAVVATIEAILARDVPHAVGKEALRNQLLHDAYDTHARTAEVPALKSNFVSAARADDGFRRFIDRTWPTLSPAAVVQRLLGSPTARRRAGADLLEEDELELLARPVAKRLADERWSAADVALIDEADSRINGTRITYGHIVVDEAQDLSTMALRMLRRRSKEGSMTVVGDLAQGTRAWAVRSWDEVAEVLRGPAPLHRAELTVGYRTPAPILDLANRLLVEAAPDVTPARSIRSAGAEPVFDATDDVSASVARHAAEATIERGTVAVVAGREHHQDIGASLDAAGVTWGTGGQGLGSVALLDPLLAKGLEFDTTIVVEPAHIVAAEPAGNRALFVALTRPTRRLVVVHREPLPSLLVS